MKSSRPWDMGRVPAEARGRTQFNVYSKWSAAEMKNVWYKSGSNEMDSRLEQG